MPSDKIALFGGEYSLGQLRDSVPFLGGIAGVRPVRLFEGAERDVLAVDVRTGSGLEYTVVPDRGMNICNVRYRGIPLDWTSGTGVVAPAYYDSSAWQWLRSFNGGLVHTCGLDNVGFPVEDETVNWDNKSFGGHGRISNTPAREVSWKTKEKDGTLQFKVSGKCYSISALEETLLLERRVVSELGGMRISLSDRITNLGREPTPIFLLYHCNFGFPLLSAQSVFTLPAKSAVDMEGRPVPDFTRITGPSDSPLEQVLYPEISGEDVRIVLQNTAIDGTSLGIAISYKKKELPYLTIWKQFSRRIYVMGVEPGACRVEGRVAEQKAGRALMLAPDETRTFSLEFEVLDSGRRKNG